MVWAQTSLMRSIVNRVCFRRATLLCDYKEEKSSRSRLVGVVISVDCDDGLGKRDEVGETDCSDAGCPSTCTCHTLGGHHSFCG